MIGTTLSHYRILASLGEGGMGVVYEAEDIVLERRVALKVLRPEAVGDAGRRQRFLQEARSAAALHHPNIATIFEANETDGVSFLAMELIDGESLRTRLARPIELGEAIRIAIGVARGLAKAHAQRVVHRDLKPENVMLARDGEAKILDFGLAKILREPGESERQPDMATATMALTRHGQIMGTPAYMSPEQARGQAVDFRSDQFAFGALLYEMVTGTMVFQGASPADTLSAVLNTVPPPPSKVDLRLPGELDRIVSRCLQKNPQDRYPDTAELVRALEALEPRRAASAQVAARRVRRLVGVRTGIAIGVVLVAALLLWLRPWSGRVGRPPAAKAVVASTPGRPNWILVADFTGTGAGADLCLATRELVTASLAQSDLVTPIGHAQVLRGLRLADRPDTTQVRGEMARELAFRAAAATYIEGRIDKVLTGYSIVLAANASDTGKPILTVNGVAENDAAVITALDRLVRELREKLGEKSSAVRSTGLQVETITPSFAAYKDYIRALELQRLRKYSASNGMLRSALAQDANFASAWKLLGVNYSNQGYLDSAQVAFDSALRTPDRLTEEERLGLQVFVAYVVQYDLEKSLELYDSLLHESSFNPDLYLNRGTVLFALGRYEEALEAQEHAAAISPYGAYELQLLNQHHTFVQVGLHDRARGLEAQLSGANQQLAALELAVSMSAWSRAESLATQLTGAGAASGGLQFQAQLVLASLQARRGAANAAAQSIQRLLASSPLPFWSDLGQVALLQLQVLRGASPDPSAIPAARDTSTAAWIVRGIAAAAGGDTVTAVRCRNAVHRKSGAEQRRYVVDARVLQGWIDTAAGRWDAVVQGLEPSMTQGPGPWFTGRVPIRWLVANAHERAGRREAAVRAYELVLDSQRLHHDVWTWRALALPFAEQRLAILQAQLGHREEAEKWARALQADWAAPDPELRPLLEAVRAALAGGV